jgi:type I restriction enzyme S subunit
MEYKLSELVNLKYGKSQKEVASPHGKYPIMGTGGIIGYASDFLYDKPSVLIGRKGSIQNVFYIDEPFWTIDTLFYTEINESKVIPRYLFYKFKTMDLMNYNEGTTIPSLRTQTLNEISLNVSDLNQQKRIVEILYNYDQKIELNNEIIANLEAQAQAIFKSWFVDFEPFQDGEFVESELGLIPEGWMVSTTGREFDIEYGKNLPTKHLLEKGYPVFGGNGQIGFFKEYLYEKPRILVSCRGAASGKVGFSKPYSYVTNNSLVFNEKKGEYFYYFKYLFNGIQFENYVTGSAQPQLTIANSKDIKILIPNKETVIRFNIIVGPYFTTQLTLSEQSTTLAQIRDTLLPKLMSGEIDVSNIKIDPEEIGHV